MKLYYIDKPELDKIKDLGVLTDALRLNVLYMVQQAGSGHIGGSLSSLDIMIDLFYSKMKTEDLFITSKGHDAPALYAILQAKGIIPFDTIHTLRRPGGLPGHPTIDVPGILFNAGSLGMGISKANGLAAADRMKGIDRKIYVLVGDGELQEGQNYEALHNLDARTVICMDRNGFQLSESAPLPWSDGSMLTYETIKGHGVSFMEGNNKYHAGALTGEEYEQAICEIIGRLPGNVHHAETKKRPYPRPDATNYLLKPYSGILAKIGADNRVICMDADLEPDCGLSEFHKLYPDRFIQCGIAEQNMVSMATGLAAGGFIPIVHSFAAFLCRRANEQIYNACLERRHIVFVGHLAGMLPTGPGTSHECLHDIELMKAMPGMTILAPENAEQLEPAMKWAVDEATGPVYVSIRCWGLEGMRR